MGQWPIALAVLIAVIALFIFSLARRTTLNAKTRSATATPAPGFTKPETVQAEELYLQGRYYWNRRTPDDLNRAIDYFTQATLRDPNYSNAYVGLADSYSLLREYSAMPPEESYPKALAAAKKAVELDDSSAEAHTSLAFVTFYWSWDAPGAEREFKRALSLNPNDARAHHWYATFLLSCRRTPESLQQINEAQILDPSSLAILSDKGDILNVANQADGAMALLKEIETTEPSFLSAHRYLSEIYLARKDYPNYLKEWREMAVLRKDQNEVAVEKSAEEGFAKGGYAAMLQATLDAQRDLNKKGLLPAYSLAVTYARLGEKQNSLQCLREAYDKHDSSLLFLSTDPAFDFLADDPEFTDLEARISPVLHQASARL
jgi:tetratricopeptide (TPR) repeat protein